MARDEVISRRLGIQENFLEAVLQIAFASGGLFSIEPLPPEIQRLGQLLNGILTTLEPIRVWLHVPVTDDLSRLTGSFKPGRDGTSQGEKLLRTLIRRAEDTPRFPAETLKRLRAAKEQLTEAKTGLDTLKSILDPPTAS